MSGVSYTRARVAHRRHTRRSNNDPRLEEEEDWDELAADLYLTIIVLGSAQATLFSSRPTLVSAL